MRSDDEGAPQIEDSPEVVEGEFREIDIKSRLRCWSDKCQI